MRCEMEIHTLTDMWKACKVKTDVATRDDHVAMAACMWLFIAIRAPPRGRRCRKSRKRPKRPDSIKVATGAKFSKIANSGI
jgi:hypothetical protein